MEYYLAFGGVVSEVSLTLTSKLDPPGDIYTGALGGSSVAGSFDTFNIAPSHG